MTGWRHDLPDLVAHAAAVIEFLDPNDPAKEGLRKSVEHWLAGGPNAPQAASIYHAAQYRWNDKRFRRGFYQNR